MMIEIFLRAINFYSPTCDTDPFISFKEKIPTLVEVKIQGKTWLSINPKLREYFNAISFVKKKPKGTRRIFILGGSTVYGFPFGYDGSFAHFLSMALAQLDPLHRYQVINLGGFGYASYRVLRVFEEVLAYQPDLIIVMSGHNEFLEKREYAQSQAKIFWLREKLSKLKIYCGLKTAIFKIFPKPQKPLLSREVKWEHFAADEEIKRKITEHYRYNLQRMAELARSKNVPVLFLTCPSNLLDFPPYHSVHSSKINKDKLAKWQNYWKLANKSFQEKKFSQAIIWLKKCLEIDKQYALSWFLLGKCYYELGKFEKAKKAFIEAKEHDAWQVRALEEFNQIIKSLAQPQIWVVDLTQVCSDLSPHKIPGKNLFYDHCHPKIEVQALIAKLILEKLNQKYWLALDRGWKEKYEMLSKSYISLRPKDFFFQAYFRLAVEIGLNMGLKQQGMEYFYLAKKLNPNYPALKKLEKLLSTGRALKP